jgi:hypothetical protein
MKNNYFKVISLAIITIAFTSCATMKINYYGKKVDKVQNVALFSTMIGKIQQPLFPLIDAAAFNEKTNSIADQIMDLQKKNIDKCQEIVASSLKKTFNCKVLYADSLHTSAGFAELKEKYDFKNSLRIENDHYPLIITAKDDINPFRFERGDVIKYFNNSIIYKTMISELGKKINTDLIAVSYSTLTVAGVGMFGIYGYLRLDTYLYMFDKDGDLISDAHTWSKPTNISGKQIEEYKAQLDNLSIIIEPMMNKVILNYQNN